MNRRTLRVAGLRRRAIVCVSTVLLALALPPPAVAGEPVGIFIENLGGEAIESLSGASLTAEQREERFRVLLRKGFDVRRISRFTLGKYARRVTPEELKAFSALFEDVTVLTYSGMFAAYSGQKFIIKRTVGAPTDRYAMVISEIRSSGGAQPVRIDWQVRVKGENYAVVDVRVEGVSMAIAQRAEFTAFLDKNKGDMNVLLDEMRRRVAAMRKKNAEG